MKKLIILQVLLLSTLSPKLKLSEKKSLFFFASLIFCCSTFVSAQVKFEAGYIINTEGVRSEVLIRNNDWRYSPKTIKYKTDKSVKPIEITIQNLKEFGFLDGVHYIRRTVRMDMSTNTTEKLSSSPVPQWEEKTVFLKAVVEGSTDLYVYENRKFIRFFIIKDNGTPEQLVYKRYKANETQIAHNYQFRSQVKRLLSCDEEEDFSRLMYTEKELSKVLVNYNECTKGTYRIFVTDKEKTKFKFGLHFGINRAALLAEDTRFNSTLVDFDRNTTFRGGIHLELILPFNKNKWSIVFQPSYHYYDRSEDLEGTINLFDNSVEVTNRSIEFPLGLRHYIYLGDEAAVFLNTFLVYDYIMKSEMVFERFHGTYTNDINTNALAFGLGAKLKDLSLEFRYTGNRDIFTNRVLFVQYNIVSLIASYNFK